MIDFKEPAPADRDWVRELFRYKSYKNSEYSFGITYMWRRHLNKKIARYKDFFIAHTNIRGGSYIFPNGRGDLKEVVEALRADAAERGELFRLYSVMDEDKQWLRENYPGCFKIDSCRFAADYVYEAQRLITLAGRKYHGKRNHIAQFERSYPNWAYEDITPAIIPELRDTFDNWVVSNQDSGTDYSDEILAFSDAMGCFEELGLEGGLIRTGDNIVSFTIGEPLTEDTYVLHFEKAFSDIPGAYPIINREYASRRLSGYQWINREEDMGLPGLRRAKESYQPAFLVDKGFATWIAD